jgi:hypothetical protein
MGSSGVYSESLSHFLLQTQSLHPAVVSCGVLAAVYFAQCAVELRIAGAWSASVASTDLRSLKQRNINFLCLNTVSVMHQFVVVWIQTLTKRGSTAAAAPLRGVSSPPHEPAGDEMGSFLVTPGQMFLDSGTNRYELSSGNGVDVLSVGTGAVNGEFRVCSAREEVVHEMRVLLKTLPVVLHLHSCKAIL